MTRIFLILLVLSISPRLGQSQEITPPTTSPAGMSTDKAQALLKEVVATYSSMQSMSADFSVSQEIIGGPPIKPTYMGKAKVKKPDLYYYDIEGVVQQIMASDGKTAVVKSKPDNSYCQMPAGPQAMNQMVTAVAPLTLFFNQKKLLAPDTPTAYVGVDSQNGTRLQIVEQTLGPTVLRYYINGDNLVERMVVQMEQSGRKMRAEMILTHIRRDPVFEESEFTVVVPKDARMFELATSGARPLAVGQSAPSFKLPRPEGGDITLTDAMNGKKAVLVTFWFYACATCRQEFPDLQKLYQELKDKGLEIVAIDSNDDQATITKYVAAAKLSFPIAMDDDGAQHFGIADKYGVSVYPTTYLLDGSGQIKFRFTTYHEQDVRDAMASLGVK